METCEKCGKPATGWTGLCYRCWSEREHEQEREAREELECRIDALPPEKKIKGFFKMLGLLADGGRHLEDVEEIVSKLESEAEPPVPDEKQRTLEVVG